MISNHVKVKTLLGCVELPTYRNAWKQTSLGHAQEDPRDKKAMVVFDNAHERHHYTPGHHDDRQPSARAELLEDEIAGNFESSVCEEKDSQAPVVLVSCQIQVLGEALDFRVSDVSALTRR